MILIAAASIALGTTGAALPSATAPRALAAAPTPSDPGDPAAPPATAPPAGVGPTADPGESASPAPVTPDPAPSTDPPVTPTPTEPPPGGQDTPTPTTPPAPTSPTSPVPTAPVPTAPTAPSAPSAPAPTLISDTSTYTATATAPTSFARYFPTNPWIYNAAPGTRYLDPRETDANGVTRPHLGIDAQGAERQPIFAVAAGTVIGGTWGTTTRDRHGYGNQIEIAHADGYATRYAHLAVAPVVALGAHVEAGQLLGYMGGSQRGNLTGVDRHLHFEVTKDGVNVDPVAFLGAAGAASEDTAAIAAAAAPSGPFLQEVRVRQDGAFVTVSTGLPVASSVYSAVDMGGDSAQVLVSAGGTLRQLAVVAGAWTDVDTHLPLEATSLSAVDSVTGFPEAFAVEAGRLVHITGSATGWTKTWTGHVFSGTVSAIRMPDGTVHAMLQQSGYLYYLRPAQGGRWDVVDTGLRVGDRVDAVAGASGAPDAMTVLDGQVHRITLAGGTWLSEPTGLPASGSVTALADANGWPLAISAEPSALGVSRVVQGVWTRYLYGVLATGPFDAVTLRGAGTVLYSVG